jgi:hypothetical protein
MIGSFFFGESFTTCYNLFWRKFRLSLRKTEQSKRHNGQIQGENNMQIWSVIQNYIYGGEERYNKISKVHSAKLFFLKQIGIHDLLYKL